MIFAGFPAMMQLFGISLTTTLPAPIVTLSPILMAPIIVTEAPRWTLFPITGRSSFDIFDPIIEQALIWKFSPIKSALIIVENG